MRHDDIIEDLLAQDRVILAREHPRLENALIRAATAGRLVRPLPGVFADPGNAADLLTKVVAVSRWDSNAVIRGRAAAALSYWPEVGVDEVEVASPTRHAPQPRFATLDDSDPIDVALRRKAADLGSLRDALQQTRRRRGNTERWRVLLDSRADPWSRAERLTHRLYRGAGIVGWVGNLRVTVPDWATYYLDIAFERQRLACEIDGRETHDNDDAFETDRERQNALVTAGWTVLRFTWRMLTEDPGYVVWATRAALALADGKPPLARLIELDTPGRTA